MSNFMQLVLAEGTVPDESLVTPGPAGFIAVMVIVGATILLIMDAVRRMRRIRMRAVITEQLDAEQAAAASKTNKPKK